MARIISRGIEGVDGVSSAIRTVESEYADDAIIDIDELNGCDGHHIHLTCLLYTSPSPRDATLSRMPSSA